MKRSAVGGLTTAILIACLAAWVGWRNLQGEAALVPDPPAQAASAEQISRGAYLARAGNCATCHSFHAPGKASPKPGHPALETLRWSAVMSGKAAGA